MDKNKWKAWKTLKILILIFCLKAIWSINCFELQWTVCLSAFWSENYFFHSTVRCAGTYFWCQKLHVSLIGSRFRALLLKGTSALKVAHSHFPSWPLDRTPTNCFCVPTHTLSLYTTLSRPKLNIIFPSDTSKWCCSLSISPVSMLYDYIIIIYFIIIWIPLLHCLRSLHHIT